MEEKILLALMPFWDPQIPPLGIACLKNFLRENHYEVKSVDANVDLQFRELHDDYFAMLRKMIPAHKQGNIFNIGNQVLRNHMMAHFNYSAADSKNRYAELLEILVNRTFFCQVEEAPLKELDEIIKVFYSRLRRYFINLLERENPTVLGLTVYGDTFPASLAAFKLAKEWNPSIKTVMGGGIFADQLAPGSPDLDYFSNYSQKFVDKIIVGEGEELFMRFLQKKLDESQRVVTLTDIGSRGLELSSNTMNIPDFSDFDLSFYPHLAHYGARSCPFQCKFCSETVNWGKYRKKDVKQTVQEFRQLYKKYSHQLFLMTDSTLNPIISDLARACAGSGTVIYWDGFLRADGHTGSTENTLLWRRGGFYRAKLGLESGSQRVLDLMNKKITTTQSKKALAALAFAGIKTTTFWLFGFPGETEEDFQQTLRFIEECQDNIYEADCNAFNYYLSGQANSRQWQKKNKAVRLYPAWAREMLVTETWILDGEPSRESAYSRLNRFVQHCDKLGMPNPYSLKEVYGADQRWKKLHKNAVPAVVELSNSNTGIDETRQVKEFTTAAHRNLEQEDFDF